LEDESHLADNAHAIERERLDRLSRLSEMTTDEVMVLLEETSDLAKEAPHLQFKLPDLPEIQRSTSRRACRQLRT